MHPYECTSKMERVKKLSSVKWTFNLIYFLVLQRSEKFVDTKNTPIVKKQVLPRDQQGEYESRRYALYFIASLLIHSFLLLAIRSQHVLNFSTSIYHILRNTNRHIMRNINRYILRIINHHILRNIIHYIFYALTMLSLDWPVFSVRGCHLYTLHLLCLELITTFKIHHPSIWTTDDWLINEVVYAQFSFGSLGLFKDSWLYF